MFYVLDWCVVCTGRVRVCCRCDVPTGLQCGTVVTVIQKPTLNDTKYSDYEWVCVTSS